MNPHQLAFFVLLAVAVPCALWKGGAPERLGAAVILLMWGIQTVAIWLLPSRFFTVDPLSLISDLIGLGGFGYLAMQARRIWPLWASSLQLLSLTAHFARWADIDIPPMVYALMRGAPTFMVLLALLIGTVLHLRRLRRHGRDPSWQDWARRAAA